MLAEREAESDALRDAERRKAIVAASDALRKAIMTARGLTWPCGHERAWRTTQTVGGISRCRECRRARWERGFRIACLRRIAREKATEARRGVTNIERQRAINAAVAGGNGRLPLDMILDEVSDRFDIPRDKLFAPGRRKSAIAARAVVIRILRERNLSFPSIGRLVGRKDHTTVRHAYLHFDTYARRDPRMAEAYLALRDRA